MSINRYLQTDFLPIPLIALMLLTRYHHFGDALHLPDASLAVFFFAGFYRKNLFLAFLLGLAGLIDYVAIANGTSAWCVSPAYIFLVPAYSVMWLAGRYCSSLPAMKGMEVTLSVTAMIALVLATSLSFFISNGSFYWLSGRFSELSLTAWFAGFIRYYPSYLSTTLLYCIAGYGLIKFIKLVLANQKLSKTV